MRKPITALIALLLLALPISGAWAEDNPIQETIDIFKNAGESGSFFERSHAYAVFPTVGRAGIGIGGARGRGQVFANGEMIGEATMTQLTVGFQLGAQGYRMIIFFQDKRALDEFTSGNFEFSAQAKAVAITAGASATASTSGSSAGASGGQNDATTVGDFNRGMATFTVARGGLMYEASLGGAKFNFTPAE